MLIDHVDPVIEMRRYAALEAGTVPRPISAANERARTTGSPAGGRPFDRCQWAFGLGVDLLAPGEETDILLWLGESAFSSRHRKVLTALILLMKKAGIRFAILGDAERDCGDLACRTGDEHSFVALARHNIAALGAVRFRRIVSADPHVVHTFRNEYSRLGAGLSCDHHTTFLAELIEQGRLNVPVNKDNALSVTYHDPCYLARYLGETEAPRKLLDSLGADLKEMTRSGKSTMCCGSGGGAALADTPGETRVSELRLQQASDTETELLVVSCPNCEVMLRSSGETQIHSLDIAELLLEAISSEEVRV